MALIREKARDAVPPEILRDRYEIWDQMPISFEQRGPSKEYITFEPPRNLKCYRDDLARELQLNDDAIRDLVTLLTHSSWGYQEGTRIIHHFIKDSRKGKEWNTGPSRFIQACVGEAKRALDDWEEWDRAPREGDIDPRASSSTDAPPPPTSGIRRGL